ncbi:hypothetical protein GOODEAATRI_005167 [Goodea atripinnis]|uniref:Nucleoside-diphosphate kinase n=1 Tax=Goodea atripinnis TaxID=208336 RepID=A0ABV0MPH1_9TELE
MEETMTKDENKSCFLIDGFPRNEDNLQGWNRVMDGKADVKFVLFFDCSNEVRHRTGERNPLQVCCFSAQLPMRILCCVRRIQTYLQSTRPIIELYEKHGKVRTVDASRSVDEVFVEVKAILDKEA